VTIGNEAVYGREGYEDTGFLGMDYIRLGLERGRTAYEALHVVVALLEEYGQGGSADRITPRSYHNSFIIADPREAWVLETAGRYWIAERVILHRGVQTLLQLVELVRRQRPVGILAGEPQLVVTNLVEPHDFAQAWREGCARSRRGGGRLLLDLGDP